MLVCLIADNFLAICVAELMMLTNSKPTNPIGYIVGGGLREALRARLTVSADEVQEGSFVTIYSGNWTFYGLVTNVQLGATDPRFADEQTEQRFPTAIAQSLLGQTLYTNVEILPVLMLERGPELAQKPIGNGEKRSIEACGPSLESYRLRPSPPTMPRLTLPPPVISLKSLETPKTR